MMLKGSYYILLHPKPDVDCSFSVALLKEFSQVNIKGYLFGHKKKKKDKDVLCVDTGEEDFDHHGLVGVTSTDLVARELGLEEEKWLQRILRFVKRADLKGMSLPFDMASIQKAMARSSDISDEEIIKAGIKMAEDVMEFSRKKMKRDNLWVRDFIQQLLKKRGVSPEIFVTYLHQLSKDSFERVIDLVEILTAEKELRGEKKAKEFGKFILEFLFEDWKRYEEALKEVEKAKKIQVGRYLIFFSYSDNPKLNVAARAKGCQLVVQKNTSGHVQIFFKRGLFDKKNVDRIVANLRELERNLNEKPLLKKEALTKEGEVENWYYFVGRGKEDKISDFFILNGSLTNPNIPPTKISLKKILKAIKEALLF